MQMRVEACEKTAGLISCCGALAEGFHPGCHKRAQQEWPDRALVIGAVSFQYASFIAGPIAAVGGRQSAEPHRRQELRFDEAKNLLRPVARDQFVHQRDGIELIGTERRIVALRAIDDIVEVAALLVPETLAK